MPAMRTHRPGFYNPHNIHESKHHRGVPLSAFGTALGPCAPHPRPSPVVLDGPGFLRLSEKLAYDSMREQHAMREWLKAYRELNPDLGKERLDLRMHWETDIDTEWPTPAEMRMLRKKGTTIFGPLYDPYNIRIYYGGCGDVVVKNVVKIERSMSEMVKTYVMAAKRGIRKMGSEDVEIVIDGKTQPDLRVGASAAAGIINFGDAVVQSDFGLLNMMAMGYSTAELVAIFGIHQFLYPKSS